MKVVLDISEPTFELCSQRLLNISFQVADVKYSLNRMDAVDLIKLITDEEKLKTLGFALCVSLFLIVKCVPACSFFQC